MLARSAVAFSVCVAVALAATACRERGAAPYAAPADSAPAGSAAAGGDVVAPATTPTGAPVRATAAAGVRTPDELGRIPVLEYHLLGDDDSRWKVSRQRFRENLTLLYERGYRPVNVTQLLDKKIDLPAGLSPVVFVFDDASPSQFSYVERNGQLHVDPNSAVGMLLEFHKQHPDWENRAVFCVLPAASAGHAFFGDKGIDGQKTEWRYKKLQFLRAQGFELCNHTLYHANLGKQTDERAQEFIARGQIAIDSAVPGYKVRTFALPLGVWPKNKPLAWAGSWRDPRGSKSVAYRYDAVLEVSGGPTRSPYDPEFDPRHITRVEVFARELEKWLDLLDKSGARYVSDGNPATVARPDAPVTLVASAAPAGTHAAKSAAATKPAGPTDATKHAAKRGTKRTTRRVAVKQ